MLICQKKDNCRCLQHVLLRSIQSRNIKKVKIFTEKIKNISELVDKSGSTLLHYSLKGNGNFKIMEQLITAGCNVNARDNDGITPLMLAVKYQDLPSVKILLQNNADIFISAHNENSSLEFACNYFIDSPIVSRKLNLRFILELLFEKLDSAFSKNEDKMKEFILNANPTMKFAALIFGSKRFVTFIVSNDKFVVNHKLSSFSGKTSLLGAMFFNKLENAKVLIQNGANVDVFDSNGMLPLYYYVESAKYSPEKEDENAELLKLLLKYSSKSTKQHVRDVERLISFGNKRTVKTLLQSESNLASIIRSSKSLLHLLIQNENHKVLDLLDELGINFNVNEKYSEVTPLMIAVVYGKVKSVEFLLKHGADVSTISKINLSLVYYHTLNYGEKKFVKMAELLLQHDITSQTLCNEWLLSILTTSFYYSKGMHLIRPIPAYLAMRSALGINFSLISTNLIKRYEPSIEICSGQVEDMRLVNVYDKVTLFDLLTKSEDEMLSYARNGDFILAFKRIIKGMPYLDPFFLSTLNNKISKAVDKIELDENAAAAVGALTGLCNNAFHCVIHKVISYLDSRHKNNLCEATNIF